MIRAGDVADHSGEIVRQVIPGHPQFFLCRGPAKDQMRPAIEACMGLRRGDRPGWCREFELPHRPACDRAALQRHGAETNLFPGVHAHGLRHDLDVTAEIGAGVKIGAMLLKHHGKGQPAPCGFTQRQLRIESVTDDAAHKAGKRAVSQVVRHCRGIGAIISPERPAASPPCR